MVARSGGRAVGTSAGLTVTAEPDLAAEDRGQRVLELGAQPALELGAGEVVGDRDDRGVAVQGDRLAGLQPGPLVGLQLARPPPTTPARGRPPDPTLAAAVHLLVVHAFPATLRHCSRGSRRRDLDPANSTPFSTACEGARRAVAPPGTQTGRDRSRGHLCRSARSSAGNARHTGGRWQQRTRVGLGDGGESRRPEPNPGERAAARRHPQAPRSGTGAQRAPRFDPVEEPRVPLAGHLPCRRVEPHAPERPLRAWAGPAAGFARRGARTTMPQAA